MNNSDSNPAASNQQIRKEQVKGAISVSRVYENEYKEGVLTAELKQTITTKAWYPSKQIATSHSDNLFGMDDFGFEEQEYTSTETRVAWIDVPVGTTKEQVEAKLAACPEAVLYRILDNKPILTDSQRYAIGNPDLDLTLDQIADRQVVRFPEGHEEAGKLALHNGKVQYRSVFFKTSSCEDIDNRTEDPAEMYLSEALKAEINNITVVEGQGLQD